MKPARALLLYEENNHCELIRAVLSAEGCEIDEAPLDTPIATPATEYCLVLFDIERLSGRLLDITRAWRDAFADGAILVVGGRAAQSNRIAVLEAGVNAYLSGPDLVPELRARVRAAIRRLRSLDNHIRRLPFAGGLIDLDARIVQIAGRDIHLTPTECGILEHLSLHANQTVPSEDLVKVLWGSDPQKGVHSLRLFIRKLRQKLEPDPAHPRYIITQPATGYRLQLPTEPLIRRADPPV